MVWIRRAAVFCFLVLISIPGFGEAPLRFSLPPVLEALPIAFAQEWGLFEAHGVTVELVGITDNQQRTAALMTGNLDGMMEDVTRSILAAVTGGNIAITSASASTPQTGAFTVALASPTLFRLDSLDALLASGYTIGTIYRSDYEYLIDRLLDEVESNGAKRAKLMYFQDMLQMAVWFGAQTLPAAVLPEPYLTYIATYHPPGGRPIDLVVHDDFADEGILPAVILFQRSVIENRADAIAAFYAAYAEAVERINRTPREELVDLGLDIVLPLFFQGADRTTINDEVLDAIPIPVFDPPAPLDESDYDTILAWMIGKGYLYTEPAFEELTDFQFVP